MFWQFHPIYLPLDSSLSLNQFYIIKRFRINTPGLYFLMLYLERTDRGQATAAREIPCKMTVTITEAGAPILNRKMDSVILRSQGLQLGYGMAVVRLPRIGQYEISIENRTDLSYLDSRRPKLRLELSPNVLVDRIVTSFVGSILCLIGVSIGLLIFVGSWYYTRKSR